MFASVTMLLIWLSMTAVGLAIVILGGADTGLRRARNKQPDQNAFLTKR